MYLTHHFAHRETLTRAHSWLTRLGFDSRRIEPHASGVLGIAVAVPPGWADAVHMLINAVERTDPDGFPSFWDEARLPHAAASTPEPEGLFLDRRAPRRSAIGWHPLD